MSFPSLPPIPADPDLVDPASGEAGFDFVDRQALQRALLGEMPMADGGMLVNGEPPRGEYAGLGKGCALGLVDCPPAPEASCQSVAPSRTAVPDAVVTANGPDRAGSVVSGGRRLAPPMSRRLSATPRAESRSRESRFGGMWVFLSSAAASVMLLLLSSLAVAQYGTRPEEPALTPPAIEPVEAVADTPPPERPPGLAATRPEGL